jgi:cyanophycinase
MLDRENMLETESIAQTDRELLLTKTAILVIGGAEDKVHGREILHTFFQRSGGSQAVLAIVPSASREPALIGERYFQIFSEMGAKHVKVLDIRDRAQCADSHFQEYIEECTGVFLTGGDQLRLCGLLSDTPLMNRIVERVHCHEITIAGTSAGAAVMGYHMIAGGGSGESPNRSLVDIAMGLAIVPEIVVDQHFHNRNRLARLLSAISAHPDRLGIGIDEDTCAMFERDATMTVMGRGTVTIVDPSQISYSNYDSVTSNEPLSLHNLRIHILGYGDRYNLRENKPMPKMHSDF